MNHIIIPCAGKGNRLGLDLPKPMVKVGGQHILGHILHSISTLRATAHIVTGFKAHKIQNEAWWRFFEGQFFLHHNLMWGITGPAQSVAVVCRQMPPDQMVVILDGDIIPDTNSLRQFVESKHPMVGFRKRTLDPDPVFVEMDGESVTAFSREKLQPTEWACVATVPAAWFAAPKPRFIYESIAPHLPLNGCEFVGVEIDNQSNLEEADRWLSTRQ